MSTTDAPDWERISVTVAAMGDVPDAPDWERIVVGPSGTPVAGGGNSNPFAEIWLAAGYGALTCDPWGVTQANGTTPGIVQFCPFSPLQTFAVGHVIIQTTGTAVLNSNENFLGVYDAGQASAGSATLLCQTATGAIDSTFGSVGTHTYAFTTTPTLTALNPYYFALLHNGSGGPSVPCLNSNNTGFWNPQGLTFPIVWNSGGSHTTLPGTFAFSAGTTATQTFLAFLTT